MKRHRRRRWPAVAGAVLVLLAAAGAGAILLASSSATLAVDASGLARVGMPLGGGKVQSVSVVAGPNSRAVPVQLRGNQIWPAGLIAAHERLTIDVVVKRPGWISWLTGSTEHLRVSLTTPTASLRTHYVTLAAGAPLVLHFKQPVEVIAYGPPGAVRRHVLAAPQADVQLPHSGSAGSLLVAAAPRSWETSQPAVVSWFPAGAATTAVASPAPGTQISPNTKITLTFSKPVSAALGSSRPPVSPITPGTWHTVNSHAIVFQPLSTGYGLGAEVSIGLPSGVHLLGGSTWRVPAGTTLRLQQLLAQLGYLPLSFNGPSVPATPLAQEQAAIKPPAGRFTWRYQNVPAPLRNFWSPGTSGVMTRGALMAFENDNGLASDGVAGVEVWRALLKDAVSGKRSTSGYTFVSVDKGSQRLTLWHDGHTVITTPVNTGIAQSPTASGTFPVFEHIRVGTMSGTNPDGSHYHDPGIQFISYFNGGDALHAFTRAQYGFPQSLGCVEMALAPAGQVWPYTPIGTLVHVA